MEQKWNSNLYDTKHNFVTNYGQDILGLLNPISGEIILDLGCGTGGLTADIAKSGAKVIGIDSSKDMILEAENKFSNIEFIIANGQSFKFDFKFDAVFSNAALHWMTNPVEVIQNIYNCLKPGGRFVFEMGGYGNIQNVIKSIIIAAKKFDLKYEDVINYYPKLGTYSSLLENEGFTVKYAETIQRPTNLIGEDGLRTWVTMFRNNVLNRLDTSKHAAFLSAVEDAGRPLLYKNGTWVADYVRLRAIAVKPLD